MPMSEWCVWEAMPYSVVPSDTQCAVVVQFLLVPAQVLCVSSRSWLSYAYQTRFHLTPLSYEVLEYASSFSSEQCPEGIVAIAQNTLR